MFGYGDRVSYDTEALRNIYPQKSLWRRWNSLSRFQKNLISLTMVGVFVCVFIFVSMDMSSGLPGVNMANRLPDWRDQNILDLSYPNASNKFLGPLGPPVVGFNKDESVKRGDIRPLSREEEEEQIRVGEIPQKKEDQVVSKPKKLMFSGPKNEKQEAVVSAFRHAWKGYSEYAWGHDHLKPVSRTYNDWFTLKLTMIDSLDTIYIMGLNEEFDKAKAHLQSEFRLDINKDVNVFETTIRVMGGLLSAYHLSGDEFFLEKALDLGNRLMPAFNTAWGVPWADINLNTLKPHPPSWNSDSTTSEVTTIQLELRDLTRCTGINTFENAGAKVSEHIHTLQKKDGLVPIFISPMNGEFRKHSTITLGARGDSYYEYLLKQWIQTGMTVDYLKEDYIDSVSGMVKHLFKRSGPSGYLFVGELASGGSDFRPKMDHLVCFLPGTLALGTLFGMPQEHLRLAEELIHTCYKTYAIQPTGLAPEITHFNLQKDADSDFVVKSNDAHNLLRPETIEGLWYMYYVTKNTTYQDWAWEIFQQVDSCTYLDSIISEDGGIAKAQGVFSRLKKVWKNRKIILRAKIRKLEATVM
ncbi:endoplasmic reticulum mannosyl-oligosaccharide 1,2-alpha-mannosidase-like isoform X1 [Artemia franciscana]|uniref:endoplasmic reticulum mannosyl-oligosaccharide 1,2-alpha-mannosidase-like isoform X1 n=1 Tax=Artemia franciscana TaxID=6661 RepID=UPI0032D9AF6E